MARRGWDIVTPAPTTPSGDGAAQVEATATPGWACFKDDIAARVRTADGATEHEIRATRRVG